MIGVSELLKLFCSHSVVTSKAKQSGIPLQEILKVAGWASDKTIAQFYDKPLNCDTQESFDSAVLQYRITICNVKISVLGTRSIKPMPLC